MPKKEIIRRVKKYKRKGKSPSAASAKKTARTRGLRRSSNEKTTMRKYGKAFQYNPD